MEIIDPESSGLTNEVSGRLSFFTRDEHEHKDDSSASALPTPNKEQQQQQDDFVQVDADMESDAVVVGGEDVSEMGQERDVFLASIKGLARPDMRMRVGERLYMAIAESHPNLAGKLTGMFLEATENLEDLSLLIFSPASLHLHLEQAIAVLESVPAELEQAQEGGDNTPKRTSQGDGPSPSRTTQSSDAPGAKRVHPRETTARQYPYNGKKARTERRESGRPWFAEIVDDTGKRTKVPCKYDAEKCMYVPTGGRDVVPGGKVGTRDKTAEDLCALDVGESDEGKLRARQKQLDIGKNTQGYKKLMEQNLRGRQLQEIIKLPYITEEGVLELTLKCSKKRYDGYLRMWKRKLYEYAGLQRLDFKGFPPLRGEEGSDAYSPSAMPTEFVPSAPSPLPAAASAVAAVTATCLKEAFADVSAAPAAASATPRANVRKQSNPSRLPVAAPASRSSWAAKVAP